MSRVAKSYYSDADPIVQYVTERSIRMTDVQKKLKEETLKHPRSRMMGAPEVVQLNTNIMHAIGAKKVLDVGVFTGVSALAAALAIPSDGKVFALDINDDFVKVGKPFWKEAGVAHKIHLHLAPATESLQKFIDNGESGTFDFAFIDADKLNYDNYHELCLKLMRPGGVIAFDNTLRSGAVIDETDQSENVVAMRKLNDKLRDDKRCNISFLNIGDGLTLLFKK
ncbi:unnamed protein product [Meganyctiphanes norvegica]|uniref:O-methyltransferase n=1 Tax=Meganyctiphanes norvegica TaxID=48144 RepID=A0AAV2Q8L1_MEGNR